MILFLVGYAGSGKSTIARRIARRLGLRVVDTDKCVEEQVGASVADIFLYEGEEYFRRSERKVVEELASDADLIVATGGGLPTWSDNMELLNRMGITIYLRRKPEQILSRLSAYGREKRPMFRGKNDEELLAFMHEQLAQREAYYGASKIVVDCATLSDDELVEYIVSKIE